jgi:hypothetical protein
MVAQAQLTQRHTHRSAVQRRCRLLHAIDHFSSRFRPELEALINTTQLTAANARLTSSRASVHQPKVAGFSKRC